MAKKSMKLKNIISIKNKIVGMIDNSQDIKRYLVYLSDCPLAKRAKLENGEMIEQPNIEESLIDKNIIPYQDYDKVISTNKALILVHLSSGDLSDSVIGKNVLTIDIICPTKENMNVGEIGEERIATIADLITDLIDEEKAGAGAITITGYEQYRIAKTPDYIGMTLFLNVETSNLPAYNLRRR